ncbi:caspase family protein [Primorskyibacter aestuariivivens]|uniref:caspase family protein n=1 Tax=Primorskyibacter aestuariivivens TaxID=1888912 RepID=UPI00230048A6|nr:caspase family protein [Primorskyibacter aestuariivivens]MDA7428052.1 caspase family protein [Primorskyibacter aestuariivivens]
MKFHIFAAVFIALSALPAVAAKQALVIGNAAYTSLDPLQNTIPDAQGYRAAFEALGYAVQYHTDLDELALEEAVISFVDGIEPGDEVAFVFSGHGWSAEGINYLIPTDAPKQGSERLLARRSLPLQNGVNGVLDDIEAQGAALSLAIIDACRDNPFEGKGTRSVGRTRGLSRIEPMQGSFVIYSAGAGQTALDRLRGDGADQRYSVFTRHFLPLLTSDMYLEDAVIVAQEQTARAARQDDHLQIPAVYRQKLGKTCLSGACSDQVVPAVAQEPAPYDGSGWFTDIPDNDIVSLMSQSYVAGHPDLHAFMYYKRDKSGRRGVAQHMLATLERDGTPRWAIAVEGGRAVAMRDGFVVLSDEGFQLFDADGRSTGRRGYKGWKRVVVQDARVAPDGRLLVFASQREWGTPDVRAPDAGLFELDINTGALSEIYTVAPDDWTKADGLERRRFILGMIGPDGNSAVLVKNLATKVTEVKETDGGTRWDYEDISNVSTVEFRDASGGITGTVPYAGNPFQAEVRQKLFASHLASVSRTKGAFGEPQILTATGARTLPGVLPEAPLCSDAFRYQWQPVWFGLGEDASYVTTATRTHPNGELLMVSNETNDILGRVALPGHDEDTCYWRSLLGEFKGFSYDPTIYELDDGSLLMLRWGGQLLMGDRPWPEDASARVQVLHIPAPTKD